MAVNDSVIGKVCSTGRMVNYSFGECANSLVMNGINGFAMICYTEALGLQPFLAGIAMSVSVLWDAVSDPIMGHISDNTHSRYGRRHSYMLFGGLLMALSFYFLWAVPDVVRESTTTIFWYLVLMNIILRTALTVYFVPYVALGFEMCTDYEGRSKLQGIRWGLNMAANLAGPAAAWSIFFRNTNDGIRATDIPANFENMGTAFAIATAFFVLLVVAVTFPYITSTKRLPSDKSDDHALKSFGKDMKEILMDPFARWVFIFVFLVGVNMVLVSSLQMYVYVYFMKFAGWRISIAHGATMVFCGIGGLLSGRMTHWFDKKGAVLSGCLLSIAANAILALVFLTGVMAVDARIAIGSGFLPIALIVFVLFHALYWLGGGIMLPVATAMMADISEINKMKTGVLKDGAYSACLSFILKVAVSFSMLLSGFILSGIGFDSTRAGELSANVIWRLGTAMMLAGPFVCMAAILVIRKYPVTKTFIEQIRKGG